MICSNEIYILLLLIILGHHKLATGVFLAPLLEDKWMDNDYKYSYLPFQISNKPHHVSCQSIDFCEIWFYQAARCVSYL